jgi:hypothetical protein
VDNGLRTSTSTPLLTPAPHTEPEAKLATLTMTPQFSTPAPLSKKCGDSLCGQVDGKAGAKVWVPIVAMASIGAAAAGGVAAEVVAANNHPAPNRAQHEQQKHLRSKSSHEAVKGQHGKSESQATTDTITARTTTTTTTIMGHTDLDNKSHTVAGQLASTQPPTVVQQDPTQAPAYSTQTQFGPLLQQRRSTLMPTGQNRAEILFQQDIATPHDSNSQPQTSQTLPPLQGSTFQQDQLHESTLPPLSQAFEGKPLASQGIHGDGPPVPFLNQLTTVAPADGFGSWAWILVGVVALACCLFVIAGGFILIVSAQEKQSRNCTRIFMGSGEDETESDAYTHSSVSSRQSERPRVFVAGQQSRPRAISNTPSDVEDAPLLPEGSALPKFWTWLQRS